MLTQDALPGSSTAPQAPLRVRVVRAGPGASLQDAGRHGHLHEGIPASGPLVPGMHLAARQSLALGATDAVLEVLLHPLVLEVESDGLVAVDGRPAVVRRGERVVVDPGARSAAYLAVPGGFDVPLVLGSRSTLPGAGVGGLEGRFLRAGDVLEARLSRPLAVRPVDPVVEGLLPDPAAPVPLVRGPDGFPDETWRLLLSTPFTVSTRFDRVGTGLDGARLPPPASDRARSLPMRRGALQVTLDGSVVVLGPDHPATGGYPVVATIPDEAYGVFAQRRPGAPVRFTASSARGPAWLAS